MTASFTSIDALVPFAKARAQRGLYDGKVGPRTQRLTDLCRHQLTFGLSLSTTVIFTRDVGHHSGGWWKNPDFERCYHLSLSFYDLMTGVNAGHRKDRSEQIAHAFYGDDVRMCWIEGPYSPEGKTNDVWHYRVFCDPAWQAIKPRGEVYDRTFTEIGWKSFSEIHGIPAADVDAPWLKATSDAG